MASMPQGLVEAMKENKVADLDSLATVYVPRASFSAMQTGVSLYRRLLPIWIYERILYRGTLTDATRRQKDTTHIKVGDENWVPTDDELQDFLKMFQETEKDPISSFIATVHGVETESIMPPGNDLRWTDMAQGMSEMKLMAIGASVAFLQGDASTSTQDVVISTFIEMVSAFRDFATARFYYEKLFPLIAHMNNHVKEGGKGKKAETSAVRDAVRLQQLQIELNETRELEYPKIQWHKTLRPNANRDYLDTLVLLEEKGVPLPIRLWAAVGGLEFDQIIKDMEKDKTDRDQAKKLKPPPPPGEDAFGGPGGGRGFASVDDGTPETAAMRNILTRPYHESDLELFSLSRTGKRKWLIDQHRQASKAHELAAKSIDRLSDVNYYEELVRKGRGRTPEY